jgi:hypothetical protein
MRLCGPAPVSAKSRAWRRSRARPEASDAARARRPGYAVA